jgi:hypothetical protein
MFPQQKIVAGFLPCTPFTLALFILIVEWASVFFFCVCVCLKILSKQFAFCLIKFKLVQWGKSHVKFLMKK